MVTMAFLVDSSLSPSPPPDYPQRPRFLSRSFSDAVEDSDVEDLDMEDMPSYVHPAVAKLQISPTTERQQRTSFSSIREGVGSQSFTESKISSYSTDYSSAPNSAQGTYPCLFFPSVEAIC
jgi:hypothetical protein